MHADIKNKQQQKSARSWRLPRLASLRTDTHTLHFVLFSSSSGGFVGEHEAGQRLFQVAHDPRCAKSGVYWSWNGGPREGRGAEALEKGGQISGGGGAGGGWDSIYENDQSAKVLDLETSMKLFQYSTEITGAKWPDLKAVTSPCPTLNVITAVTKGMVQREELKRIREMGSPGITAEEPIKVSRAKKTAAIADRVVTGVLSNTIAPVARFAGKRILGTVPDEAIQGSYHAKGEPEAAHFDADKEDLTREITAQLAQELNGAASVVDKEDEALFEKIYSQETGEPTDKKTSVVA
jgi:hypothetical protein